MAILSLSNIFFFKFIKLLRFCWTSLKFKTSKLVEKQTKLCPITTYMTQKQTKLCPITTYMIQNQTKLCVSHYYIHDTKPNHAMSHYYIHDTKPNQAMSHYYIHDTKPNQAMSHHYIHGTKPNQAVSSNFVRQTCYPRKLMSSSPYLSVISWNWKYEFRSVLDNFIQYIEWKELRQVMSILPKSVCGV